MIQWNDWPTTRAITYLIVFQKSNIIKINGKKNCVEGNESKLHFGTDTAVQRSVCRIESIVVPAMKSGNVKCAPALIKLTQSFYPDSLSVWRFRSMHELLHGCISPLPFSLSCTHAHIPIEWPHTTMGMQATGFSQCDFKLLQQYVVNGLQCDAI